jgi:replicative DNA helicase
MAEIVSLRAVENMPQNIEAEQALLGAILLDNAVLHKVSHALEGRHFFDPVHARIFEAAASAIRDGRLASPVTMKLAMDSDSGLAELGGPTYLVKMAAAAMPAGAAADYLQIVIDAYQRRTMLGGMDSARQMILRGESLTAAQGEIEAAAADVALVDQNPPTVSAFSAASRAVERARRAYMGEVSGIMTGLDTLDKMTGGLQGGDLIVIPAAPAMGKTAFALCMAMGYARRGHGVAYVSLEMGDLPLADRAISNISGVPYQNIPRGDFLQQDGVAIAKAAEAIGAWDMQIVQSHVRTAEGIYAAARRIQKAWEGQGKKLQVLFVDYLQLIEGRGNSRAEIVTNASVALKSIAMRMNIPVIALAQINVKALADRDDKMPRLSDIRESGQIEQDASLIMFVHREEYYLERNPPKTDAQGKMREGAAADYVTALEQARGKMEIFLAKNRHGAINRVTLGCDLSINQVWDL